MSRYFEFHSVKIPFKDKFTHGSFERSETETVIVTIKDSFGVSGYGESCPRSYVTGETCEGAIRFLKKNEKSFHDINSLEHLLAYVDANTSLIDKNPAAFCSVELALIDLIARENNVSAEVFLNLKSNSTQKKNTAVLGIDSYTKFCKKLFFYTVMGFEDFKLKISGNREEDLKRLKTLSYFSKSIRVDANNLFEDSAKAIDYLKSIKKYIWAVEEPLKPYDYLGMKRIIAETGLKIILDESFLSTDDLLNLQGHEKYFIPNLRISKQGGILRTIQLIRKLDERNINWIMGSHVGEMSLLTKASLIISRNFNSHVAKEGGFSTFLLKEDFFHPNLKLSIGAKIRDHKTHAGFGLEFRKKK